MKTEAFDSRRQDPATSHKPRGKDRSERRHRNDPGWTGTEEHRRNNLMRQFMRTGEGGGGNSAAYRAGYDAIDWSK